MLKNKISLILLIICLVVTYPTLYATSFEGILSPVVSTAQVQEKFKTSMTNFLQEKDFPEAVVSVYKDGKLLVNDCYGTCEGKTDVYPIASVSKLFTELAINKLISENAISSSTKVLDYLGINYPIQDPRVKEVTVEQLVNHTGGWDRDLTEDPLFSFDRLPKNIQSSNEEFLKYVLQNYSLDHDPGTVESYCNFGYFLLGLVIEKATGEKYIDYLNKEFAEPNNIRLYQAKTPVQDDPELNCFKLELATASFGLAANISDLSYFFSKVDLQGLPKVKSPKEEHENWWKDGSLPGSVTSLVKQRCNNVVISVYIPSRDEDNWMQDNEALNQLIDYTASQVGL